MTKIVLAAIIVVWPGWAVAQQSDKPKKPPRSDTQRSAGSNPCAIYGAGFRRIEGTNTCIKIGGSVTVEGGGSLRR